MPACRFCIDTGVEYYELDWKSKVRPCIHCERGKELFQIWCTVGWWKDLPEEEIDRRMAEPCGHEPERR